jgi:hypothetical protein
VAQELSVAIDLMGSFGRPAFVVGTDQPRLGRLSEGLVTRAAEGDRAGTVRRIGRDELRSVVAAALAAHRSGPSGGGPLRVLVIGDSTSRNLAKGLAAASAGWLEVISAGVIGCPLVRTERVVHRSGEEWSTQYCPSHEQGWPEAVAAFGPDLVLAVAGVTEQQDQWYPGIDGWQRPGTEGYQSWHDAELESLLAMLAPTGTPVLLLDAPDVGARQGRTGTEPERRLGWNLQLVRWAETWQPVGLVPYAHLLAPADSDQGRAERPDGIHPTDEVMERIAREHLVGALLLAYAEVTSLIDGSGCRVTDGDGPRFVLEQCREV